ncbi:TlpA family protein disulfide reductase [Thalassobacillus hwangdonensis]|uniref:TlpA family protein disulfide reductase n=1 Tax=Thalassobacillus hwangdonensis TaxID=546108 RepID=A0ABW3L392_9BACI
MKKAPSFCLPEIESGQPHCLDDYAGKVVVLTFWASWCPDCSRDLPQKEQLHGSMDSNKVKLIAINAASRERAMEEGSKFSQKFLNQLSLVDNDGTFYKAYECEGVPSTIIIDQAGNIAGQFGDKADFLSIVSKIGELID